MNIGYRSIWDLLFKQVIGAVFPHFITWFHDCTSAHKRPVLNEVQSHNHTYTLWVRCEGKKIIHSPVSQISPSQNHTCIRKCQIDVYRQGRPSCFCDAAWLSTSFYRYLNRGQHRGGQPVLYIDTPHRINTCPGTR